MSGLLALTLGLGISGTAFAAQDLSLSKKSPGYSQEFETQMTKVMTNVDYLGWKNLVQNKTGKVDPLITADNFPKFAEAWKLAKEGKIKEANAIRKELGLKTSGDSVSQKKDTSNQNKINKANKIKKVKTVKEKVSPKTTVTQ